MLPLGKASGRGLETALYYLKKGFFKNIYLFLKKAFLKADIHHSFLQRQIYRPLCSRLLVHNHPTL